MKKRILLLISLLLMNGCSKTNNEKFADHKIDKNEIINQTEEIKLPRMIMVNNTIYYDTGKRSSITVRCGVMDGYINSTVPPIETPLENNTSNFGKYGYQFGIDDTIDVWINGNIIVFSPKVEESTLAQENYILIQDGKLENENLLAAFLEKVNNNQQATVRFFKKIDNDWNYYELFYKDVGGGQPSYIYSLIVDDMQPNTPSYLYESFTLDVTNGIILKNYKLLRLIEFVDDSIVQVRETGDFIIYE